MLRGRLGLGAGLFFVLLAAALVCAVLVVRARSPDLVLEVTAIEPAARVIAPGDGSPPGEVELRFFVRESDPGARVEIIDAQEDAVAVLDPNAALDAGDEVRYVWDGRTDAGVTRPGRYRLRVVLPAHDREMVWPQRVTVLPPMPERGPTARDRTPA